jgi:acetoin utilization deacetylase AcuC-like enzyme
MSIPVITHPDYSFPFPPRHRFPMEKFALLHTWLRERGIATPANTLRPGRARPELLALAHCPAYLQRFVDNTMDPPELRRLGLPWSEGLRRRTLIAPAGTLLTAWTALRRGIACHLAGGTHHAHYDFGSGFCVLNDLAVTAKALLRHGQVQRLLIFDCDVHQGDGTASILADEPNAFTCSIHCDKNFPARKATSDWDVEVPRGTRDQDYLQIVESTLLAAIARVKPDLVLYDAGVDIYSGDPLGLLEVSQAGVRAREYLVLETCKRLNLPVATVIGGGYDDDRHALIRRHALVVEAAADVFKGY